MKSKSHISRTLPVEMAALGFLVKGPLHGYDLHRQIERELGPVWKIGIGHLYNALRELERQGLVTSTVISQGEMPPRKVYSITATGHEAFLGWLHRPVPAVRDIRVEFLAKLYFCLRGVADPQELLATQTVFLQERLAQIERAWAETAPGFYRLVLDLRRRQMRAVLEWLQNAQTTLLQEKQP